MAVPDPLQLGWSSGSDIDAATQAVLSQPEYAHARTPPGVETEALGELFDALLALIEALVRSVERDHPALFGLLIVVGGAVLLVALSRVARQLHRRGADAAPTEQRASATQIDMPALARAARDAGDLAGAMRWWFWSGIVGRARREGLLEPRASARGFRADRTYQELAREFGRGPTEQAELHAIAATLDGARYGARIATIAEVERAEALATRMVRRPTSVIGAGAPGAAPLTSRGAANRTAEDAAGARGADEPDRMRRP